MNPKIVILWLKENTMIENPEEFHGIIIKKNRAHNLINDSCIDEKIRKKCSFQIKQFSGF